MHDYKKLTNQPLIFVLTEFHFSPVLDMGRYIPEIQDLLRVRFPKLRMNESQEVSISHQGISLNTQPNWEFISKDNKEAATLNQNRLLFMTSKYERFEGFNANCDFLLKAILETANPSLLLKIGLRYSNTILAIKDKGLAEEFVKTRLFENSDLHSIGSPIRQTNETLLKTSEGALFVRSLHGINNFSVWPDAENFPIDIEIVSNNSTSRILLDLDHLWDAQEESVPVDFKKDFMLHKLEKMHEINRRAFWDVTTEKAKEAWK